MPWFRRKAPADAGARRARERSCTLMLVPGGRGRVRSLVVRERHLRAAVAAAAALALAGSLFAFDYVRSRLRASEAESLRTEARDQRETSARLARGFAEIEEGMSRLRTLEARLRTAFDLEKERGGRETPRGIGGGQESIADLVDGTDARRKGLDARIDRELERLRDEAAAQERGLAELLAFLEERRSLLAATPSLSPVRGWVTSGFERRQDPFTQHAAWHRGIDISAGHGAPVVAPADGVVTFVGRMPDFGNALAIDHGYGFLSRFGHNSRVLVRPGQRVSRGQEIAFVGNSGKSTGPHLHYEVLKNGVPVDPQDYLLN